MERTKVEFTKLIQAMGWTQSETARQLHMTPGAVNHLVNPKHPNKPSRTAMQLLKLIVASERPEAMDSKTFELRAEYMNRREFKMMQKIGALPSSEQERLYRVVEGLIAEAKRRQAKRK